MTANRSDTSVLVTGGAGYIGSHAVLALRKRGYTVVVLDNLSTGHRALVPAGIDLVVGDISDSALVRQVIRDHRCRAVLHFAASVGQSESIEQPLKYYRNNTVASQCLIESSVLENIATLIFASTAGVYGSPDHFPVSESDVKQTLSPYGSSKLMTEWMLRDAAAAHGLNYGILRCFNVAGADPKGRTGSPSVKPRHLIEKACAAAVGQRQSMTVFGTDYATADGTCIRDYVHVSDLADAHVLALEHVMDKRENVILNCGNGRGFSVLEVLDAVQSVAKRPIEIVTAARRPGDVPAMVSNSEKIRKTLSWSAKWSGLQTIIESTLDWRRQLADIQAVQDETL